MAFPPKKPGGNPFAKKKPPFKKKGPPPKGKRPPFKGGKRT